MYKTSAVICGCLQMRHTQIVKSKNKNNFITVKRNYRSN